MKPVPVRSKSAPLPQSVWFGGYVAVPALVVLISALALSGCSLGETSRKPPIEVWPDMDRQEKFKAQTGVGPDLKPVFPDGRSNRRPPEGTIARGQLRLDAPASTGLAGPNVWSAANPVKLDAKVMALGQLKFNVNCAPCHDRTGSGKGIVNIKEPTYKPSNLQEDRIRNMVDGEIFYVITHGRRTMGSYRYALTETERWSVVYYVRALQRAAHGSVNDLPEAQRAALFSNAAGDRAGIQ